MQEARRRGKRRAQIVVAKCLAVVQHRLWIDGTEFRTSRSEIDGVVMS